LVHSVLYWSVMVARLACSKKTKHISSLAVTMSHGAYSVKWYSGLARLLDKLTYKKSETLIGATTEVLKDFDHEIGIRGRSKVIYNFVNNEFFDHAIEYELPVKGLKLVAVGNYREQKNYQYLVDSFRLLKDRDVSIDVYGQGHLREMLQEQIDREGLKISLMGPHTNLHQVLPAYDALVMCSVFEGFGIAAAEAMAIGLPVLLSKIPVLQEVSLRNAYFFNPRKPAEFARIVKQILIDNSALKEMSDKGKLIANKYYTKANYINSLFELFDDVLANKPYRKQTFSPLGFKPRRVLES
ncbi:MAG: glycosyltransferase family 4 protein, partial [Chitinophagaceae bacterium]